MEEVAAVLGIISAILAILVTLMKIWRSQNNFPNLSPRVDAERLDRGTSNSETINMHRNSMRYGLTHSQVEKLRSANQDAFRDLYDEFRIDTADEAVLVKLMKEFRDYSVHTVVRDGKSYRRFAMPLKPLGDPDIERELRLGEFSRTLTKEESLKLRMDLAREAEKKERVEPIPDCPDYLARFVGLIPEEVLAEFGTEEYVNHMRDELQNARLKGKSTFKVILENVYEFTIQAGKSRLRFGFRRRTSIK